MIHDLHALLWFQSHLSPFAAHPTTTPRMPAPNTSLPAKYVGRQVIQGERGLRPCRESQWDLHHCPSQSVAAQQYSNNSLLPAVDIVGFFSLRVISFDHMDSGKHFLFLYVEVHFYFFLRMEDSRTLAFSIFHLCSGDWLYHQWVSIYITYTTFIHFLWSSFFFSNILFYSKGQFNQINCGQFCFYLSSFWNQWDSWYIPKRFTRIPFMALEAFKPH